MTEETPAKVMSLLGVSLFSLAFLFAISASNASFRGPEVMLPDPFNPQPVVRGLDVVAYNYSQFIHQNLTGPAVASFAFFNQSAADNLAWMKDQNTDVAIVDILGLQSLTTQPPTPPLGRSTPGSVAGAFTMRFAP